MNEYIIFGVHITNRINAATNVQKVLTDCGCSIKTRIGLHEVDNNACSPQGLILLEMYGEKKAIDDCEKKLASIDGVELQKMVFKK